MSALSVKQRLNNRVIELLEALKTAGALRSVQRVTRAAQLEATLPCAQLIVGDETVDIDEEDTRGFSVTFPLYINLVVSDAKDPAGKLDELVAKVQAAIEADVQLTQLARRFTYTGDDVFYSDEQNPVAANTLAYQVHYRRQRAKPNEVY